MHKLSPSEYSPLFQNYINLVPSDDVVHVLEKQMVEHTNLFKELTDIQAQYCYAPGKWSIKTVIGHIADVERLWQYRLLRIARGDVRQLPGYDRDVFATLAQHNAIAINMIADDYTAVRQATLSLIRTLTSDSLERTGDFNDHPLSARAILFLIAGHELHHVNILKTRYLINV